MTKPSAQLAEQGVLDLRVAARSRAAKAAAPAAKPSLSVVPEKCRRRTEGQSTSDIQEVKVTNQKAALRSRWRDGVATGVMFVAALALAAVSGTFAVVGLTSIFAGAFWPVIAMGSAMELGKLSAVGWLGRRHRAPLVIKVAISALVVTLMGLNAIGAYGFLAHSHIEQAVSGETSIDARNAGVTARRDVQVAVVADLDKRIAQVDAAVSEATRRGRTATAMAVVEKQSRYRAELVSDRLREAKKLAALQIEGADVVGDRARLAANSGPIRYLAALIGASDTVLAANLHRNGRSLARPARRSVALGRHVCPTRGRAMSTAIRQRLPDRRASSTFEVEAFGLRFTVTASSFAHGGLGELFIRNHKCDSGAGIMASDSAIAASLALQFGCPAETLRRALSRDARGNATGPLGVALDALSQLPPADGEAIPVPPPLPSGLTPSAVARITTLEPVP